jgi:hypothetical protein
MIRGDASTQLFAVLGPVSLTQVACTSNAPTKICTSGGPC